MHKTSSAPLTKKRQKWARERKVRIIRGKPLQPNAGIREWYELELTALCAEMAAVTGSELKALFTGYEPEFPTEDGWTLNAVAALHADLPQAWTYDESISSQARITLNRLRERLFGLFDTKAKRLAKRFLLKQDRFSKASLAESLREMSGGLSVKTDFYTGRMREAINASINYNTGLIKSIPQKFHQQIEGAVQRSILSGKGMADLVPELEKFEGMTRRRAQDIALDQTKKTYAAITRHRMEGAGITHFEWLHSGGSQRPRVYHQGRWPNGLNGGIFPINEPPVTDPKTGHRSFPGEDKGCNCRMRPVILLGNEEAAAA